MTGHRAYASTRSQRSKHCRKKKLAPLRKKLESVEIDEEIDAEKDEGDDRSDISVQSEEHSVYTDEHMSEGSIEESNDQSRIKLCKESLEEMGLSAHLKSVMGKSDEVINTFTGRCAEFLLYAYRVLRSKVHCDLPDEFENSPIKHLKWTSFLAICRHLPLLTDFCDEVLLKEKSLKPSTIRNHLLDFEVWARWYTSYRFELDDNETIPPANGLIFCNHGKIIRSLYSKLSKKNKVERSVEGEVKAGRMLPGGLMQLQGVVRMEMEWMRTICAQPEAISKKIYDLWLGFMFAAFYVDSPQGRIGGFQHIDLAQFPQLMAEDHATTPFFKTSQRFGLQAFGVREFSKSVLELYEGKMRPMVAGKTDPQSEALFIDYHGVRIKSKDIGIFIKKSLNRVTGYNITSNGIRSCVETAMAQAYHKGQVGPGLKDAVHNLNGHSSKISDDVYHKNDRRCDTDNAHHAFDILEMHGLNEYQQRNRQGSQVGISQSSPSSSSSYSSFSSPSCFASSFSSASSPSFSSTRLPLPQAHASVEASSFERLDFDELGYLPLDLPEDLEADVSPRMSWNQMPAEAVLELARQVPAVKLDIIQWGTSHPHFTRVNTGKTCSVRAEWTSFEVDYIRECHRKILLENPACSAVAATILKEIIKDPTAWPIFHTNHVRNSAALKHGCDKATGAKK